MDSIIIFCAKYLFVVPVVLAGWVWLKSSKANKIKFCWAAFIAGAAAVVLAKLAGKLFYDPRPFVSHNVKPLIPHAPDNGFPSDHTWFVMTISALMYFYGRSLFWATLSISLVVGVARVLAHLHSPIDIVGGIAIGMLAGWFGHWAAKKLISNPKPAKQT